MPEKKRSKVEAIKESSHGLRGSLEEDLNSGGDQFTKDNIQLLKFHGVYQCDDRDLRQERRKAGLGKAFKFMVRIMNPGGGVLIPEQWETLNEIVDRYGDGSLRITTRQGIQFYGVGKQDLKGTIQALDKRLISTFGACGDGVRNTMACPVSRLRKGSNFDGQYWANKIADRLDYKSSAYYDIWLDGKKLNHENEPLYGKSYLPRKFKIALSDPLDNCVDVLTNDVGLLPSIYEDRLEGFHVFVGGGLGATHKKEETFPRLAEPLSFVFPESFGYNKEFSTRSATQPAANEQDN